jgi:hypothetical protein
MPRKLAACTPRCTPRERAWYLRERGNLSGPGHLIQQAPSHRTGRVRLTRLDEIHDAAPEHRAHLPALADPRAHPRLPARGCGTCRGRAAQTTSDGIVERRRRERSEHDPGDELERDRREARARRAACTDCEHDRDRSELEEEPRSVPRRGEDQPLTARGGLRGFSAFNRSNRSSPLHGRAFPCSC